MLRPTRIRDNIMKKLSILFAMLFIAFTTTINAEDFGIRSNAAHNASSTSFVNVNNGIASINEFDGRRPKYGRGGGGSKRSLGAELDYNFMRLGLGVKYGYNFTDVCRFVLQADYYILSSRPVNEEAGSMSSLFWGRWFDIAPSLNFVYGNGDFHFYLITGLSIGFGYNEGLNILSSISEDGAHDENGDGKFQRNELIGNPSFGFRLGCGVEYNISDSFRLYWEQALDLAFPISSTNWMMRLGGAYCF